MRDETCYSFAAFFHVHGACGHLLEGVKSDFTECVQDFKSETIEMQRWQKSDIYMQPMIITLP
jgi:hypothetical protein